MKKGKFIWTVIIIRCVSHPSPKALMQPTGGPFQSIVTKSPWSWLDWLAHGHPWVSLLSRVLNPFLSSQSATLHTLDMASCLWQHRKESKANQDLFEVLFLFWCSEFFWCTDWAQSSSTRVSGTRITATIMSYKAQCLSIARLCCFYLLDDNQSKLAWITYQTNFVLQARDFGMHQRKQGVSLLVSSEQQWFTVNLRLKEWHGVGGSLENMCQLQSNREEVLEAYKPM